MEISKLQDIDLSEYKLAFFKWDCFDDSELSGKSIMTLADAGGYSASLYIWLIPNNKRLQDCDGDDRDDSPAEYNASWFFTYPKGTILLKGDLGGELMIVDSF